MSSPARFHASAVFCLLAGALGGACIPSDYILLEASAGAGGASGSSGPGSTSPECGLSYLPGNTFQACTASYWGSVGLDSLAATAIGPRGEVLVAGRTAQVTFADAPLDVSGYDGGVALLLGDDARSIRAVARVGADITDAEVDADGVLLATTQGIVALDTRFERIAWRYDELGAVTRLATSGKTVAALSAAGDLVVLGREGVRSLSLPLPGDALADVAVSEALGLVYVTGSHDVASGSCSGQMPFLRAYAFDGTLRWKAYDFSDAGSWCASSRGRRLVLGSDDKLFYAGEQQGGNSVHFRQPNDLDSSAPLVAYDEFSQGAGKAIQTYSFVARFDAETGSLELAQAVLPRQAGVGGQLFTSALAVDAAGRVFLGGQVSCCIETREQRVFAGQPLGEYSGPEASLLIIASDFQERLSWTSFSRMGGGDGNVTALALGPTTGIAVVNANADAGSLITLQALQAMPSGGLDGYWVKFPTPE